MQMNIITDIDGVNDRLSQFGHVRIRVHRFYDSHWTLTLILSPHQQPNKYLTMIGCVRLCGDLLASGKLVVQHSPSNNDGERLFRLQNEDETFIAIGSNVAISDS